MNHRGSESTQIVLFSFDSIRIPHNSLFVFLHSTSPNCSLRLRNCSSKRRRPTSSSKCWTASTKTPSRSPRAGPFSTTCSVLLSLPLSTQNATPQATLFLPFSPSSKSSRLFSSRSKTTPTSRNPPKQGRSVRLSHSLEHSDYLHGYWGCEKHERAAHMHRPHGQLLPTICGCAAQREVDRAKHEL